jgi:hypothetical protein
MLRNKETLMLRNKVTLCFAIRSILMLRNKETLMLRNKVTEEREIMLINYLFYIVFIVIGFIVAGYSTMYRIQVRRIERETGISLNHSIRALILIWIGLSLALIVISTVCLLISITVTVTNATSLF